MSSQAMCTHVGDTWRLGPVNLVWGHLEARSGEHLALNLSSGLELSVVTLKPLLGTNQSIRPCQGFPISLEEYWDQNRLL